MVKGARQLTRFSDWEDALNKSRQGAGLVLFKHSPACGISAMARSRLASAAWLSNPDIYYVWVDVIHDRELSKEIAAQTGVRHESPQLLWFKKGEVIGNASHFNVRPNLINPAELV